MGREDRREFERNKGEGERRKVKKDGRKGIGGKSVENNNEKKN